MPAKKKKIVVQRSPSKHQLSTAATACAGFLLIAGAAFLGASLVGESLAATLDFGAFSRHMAQHVFLMNLAAPLTALALLSFEGNGWVRIGGRKFGAGFLAAATAMQIALLWSWHLPPALEAAGNDPLLMAAMHVSLFLAALWFWIAVLATETAGRWMSIFALLLTGKLFCLLGAILVFAPRSLYPGFGHHAASPGASLADQQLAGLIMIVSCPLTFVLAGIILAYRWLLELGEEETVQPGLAVARK
jgi:putative membrane protein